MSETTPSQAKGTPEEEQLTEPYRTTPSQAEGERGEEEQLTELYQTTPSQAEGERDEENEQASADGGGEQP